MVTDEERREVARRIRMGSPDWVGDHHEKWLGPAFGTIVLSGGGKDEIESAARHLADLIDHEPERTCHVVASARKVSQMQALVTKSCSCCGYVFGNEEHRPLLPGLDEEIVLDEVRIQHYCPECGAKVVEE